MQNLIKESRHIYQQYVKFGPTFLDSFDHSKLTNYTLKALQQKSVQYYINKNFTIYQEISMLPIQFEEDNSFAFAIFTLAPGIVMPLHDHPEMFVLSYILHGEGEREGWNINDINTVNQYKKSIEKKETIVEAVELPRLPLKTGDLCYTTPNNCNLHSFINKSMTNPFIFLDIIVPHYDNNRVITYYERKNKNQLRLLEENEQKQQLFSL